MLLLCYTLQSFRYVFVPIFTIAGSTMLSFCILLPVAQHMSMASVAPNLVMVLSIALSVDYNLFIISRIREEFLAGRELPIAVAIALLTAGNTVVVSGLTLVFCTLGTVALLMYAWTVADFLSVYHWGATCPCVPCLCAILDA